MINFAANLNKMINAGLGGPLDPPRTEVAVGHRVVYTEASGAVVNFESNVIAPVKNIRVTMEPVQAGSGDPSPENIRTITGRDSVTVYHTARNLLPINLPSNAFAGTFSTGSTSIASAAKGRCWCIYVGKNVRLRYSCSAIGTGLVTAFADELLTSRTGAVIYSALSMLNRTDTTINSGEHPYLVCCVSNVSVFTPKTGAFDVHKNMIAFGTVTLPYESRRDFTADAISLDQTVYGGTLDVSSGICHSLWANIPSYAGEDLPGEWISDRDVYAPGTVPTIGAQVVYKREVADMIILTPVQLNTLAGENNVWSDAGNISLEYPCYEETEGY